MSYAFARRQHNGEDYFAPLASGIVFARTATGVLETIDLIGSAFYGPVLDVFTLGTWRRALPDMRHGSGSLRI